MAVSEKPAVIRFLFEKYWDSERETLRKTIMDSSDVVEGIEYCNEHLGTDLSTTNPANFMKDVVRGAKASRNWPDEISRHRITAEQISGNRAVFKFIPYKPDQTEPFPDTYQPDASTPVHQIETISIPLVTKSLGRSDEPWLIQTAVNLRLIETHFALESPLNVVEMSHLQMSIKLRRTEIDALFMGRLDDSSSSDPRPFIVTCEAKKHSERLLEHQIIQQAKDAFAQTAVDIVVPIGLRGVKRRGLYVAEFRAVYRDRLDQFSELELESDGLYEFQPPMVGV